MSSEYTSTILTLKRVSGNVIPYEYNFYLALAFYSKLEAYSKDIRKLHERNSISIHTFSNIITTSAKSGLNGLSIDSGFVIFRSLDKRMESYLRLSISNDQFLRICDTTYMVKSIKSVPSPEWGNTLEFRTLSPVIVREFDSRTRYVDSFDELRANLERNLHWVLEKKLLHVPDHLELEIKQGKRKTVRISSQNKKESITTGFNITGTLKTDRLTFNLLYHKGLGSKTGLGLGCFEVSS